MSSVEDQLTSLLASKKAAAIKVQTLGIFQVWRGDELVPQKDWGRDVTVQLFQFFITARQRRGLRKEQIIDRLWGDVSGKAGEQNFKVALHGINKVLEPKRKSRTDARYIFRQGLTYQLKLDELWIDAEAIEHFISIGNASFSTEPRFARMAYETAHQLYQGIYLPNRLYEDWSSEERERLQVLILGAIMSLSELLVEENPMESIRLAQNALQIEPTWEDAYRIQMEAYINKGNRPMAIKTFDQCKMILEQEYGIEPLPETKAVLQKIRSI